MKIVGLLTAAMTGLLLAGAATLLSAGAAQAHDCGCVRTRVEHHAPVHHVVMVRKIIKDVPVHVIVKHVTVKHVIVSHVTVEHVIHRVVVDHVKPRIIVQHVRAPHSRSYSERDYDYQSSSSISTGSSHTVEDTYGDYLPGGALYQGGHGRWQEAPQGPVPSPSEGYQDYRYSGGVGYGQDGFSGYGGTSGGWYRPGYQAYGGFDGARMDPWHGYNGHDGIGNGY